MSPVSECLGGFFGPRGIGTPLSAQRSTVYSYLPARGIFSFRFGISPPSALFSTESHDPRVNLNSTSVPAAMSTVTWNRPSGPAVILTPSGRHRPSSGAPPDRKTSLVPGGGETTNSTETLFGPFIARSADVKQIRFIRTGSG